MHPPCDQGLTLSDGRYISPDHEKIGRHGNTFFVCYGDIVYQNYGIKE